MEYIYTLLTLQELVWRSCLTAAVILENRVRCILMHVSESSPGKRLIRSVHAHLVAVSFDANRQSLPKG